MPYETKDGSSVVAQIVVTRIITPANAAMSVEVDALAYQTLPSVQVFPLSVRWEGARMLQVMTDAKIRADEHQANGAAPGLALYMGIRDAMYEGMAADGVIKQAGTVGVGVVAAGGGDQ